MNSNEQICKRPHPTKTGIFCGFPLVPAHSFHADPEIVNGRIFGPSWVDKKDLR